MSAGSMIIAKQNQAMRKFREAGAISPECAETLDVLKLSKSRVFKVLLSQGVFKETSEHSYWLDARGAKEFIVRRRNRLMFLLLVIAVSFAISYL